MTIRWALRAAALALALLLPGLASAASVVATGSVNMRAGPGTEFPVVATLPAGARAEVYGCVEGRTWCDTAWGGVRGWVTSAYLTLAYRRAPVAMARVPVGASPPIIVYDPEVYYRTYYAGRPWYRWRAPRSYYVGPNHACVRGPRGVACR